MESRIRSRRTQLNALEKSNLMTTWPAGRLLTSLLAACTAASAPPETPTPNCKSGSKFQFIDTLRKNFLNQYVSKPTRVRGDDHPHILDLVLTNESFIENIAMRAPLGTRSSAIAEGPRDASCQLKSCQLPRNSVETTYLTSPDQIDGRPVYEIWSL